MYYLASVSFTEDTNNTMRTMYGLFSTSSI